MRKNLKELCPPGRGEANALNYQAMLRKHANHAGAAALLASALCNMLTFQGD